MDNAIEPFPIRFDGADLDDLRRRLEATRLPEAMEGSGWSRGIDLEWLRGLLNHWRRDFDWRAVERRLALEDSPAALCAWIVSKFRAWSDCGGDVESRFTRDELLANVTWYWLTRSATSAARLYHESRRSGRLGAVESRVEVPTACAIFPREMFRPPRSWAERIYNVQRWTEMKSGGHFAAMEEPEALVEDVRAFFRELR